MNCTCKGLDNLKIAGAGPNTVDLQLHLIVVNHMFWYDSGRNALENFPNAINIKCIPNSSVFGFSCDVTLAAKSETRSLGHTDLAYRIEQNLDPLKFWLRPNYTSSANSPNPTDQTRLNNTASKSHWSPAPPTNLNDNWRVRGGCPQPKRPTALGARTPRQS